MRTSLIQLALALLEGRNFFENSETDIKESIIVNEQFLTDFNIEEGVGTRVVQSDTTEYYIVGVMKNFYLSGFWNPIRPTALKLAHEDDHYRLLFQTNVGDATELYRKIEKQWKALYPNEPLFAFYQDDELIEAKETNNNILILFLIIGIVAIVLSASGLFTLASLNIIKRTKEIGVRKVLGATILHIAKILNTEFVVILLIASVLGSGLGYFLVNRLLSSIWAYHVSPGAIGFILAIIIMFVVALSTISYKVYKAALMNPVVTLRYE